MSAARRRLLLLLGLLVLTPVAVWAGRHLWAVQQRRAAQHLLDDFGDPQTALHRLDACLAIRPGDATAHLLAARAARRLNDYDRAEGHLDALPAGEEETTVERTLLRVQRDGLSREAEAFLTARVGEDDTTALPILEVLSGEYMRTHRMFDARRLLNDWLRRRPDLAEARVRRGWVAQHMFDRPGALADYEAALEKLPERRAVRQRVADLLLIGKQPAKALPHLERLHTEDPDDAAARLALAVCKADLGDTAAARRLLQPLLTRDDAGPGTWFLAGRLALVDGELDEAERWLRRAVAGAPFEREMLYNLQVCLKQLGKTAEATALGVRVDAVDADLKLMERLMLTLQQRPRDVALRCDIADVFLRNGLAEDGVRWLNTVLEIDPDNARARKALAEQQPR